MQTDGTYSEFEQINHEAKSCRRVNPLHKTEDRAEDSELWNHYTVTHWASCELDVMEAWAVRHHSDEDINAGDSLYWPEQANWDLVEGRVVDGVMALRFAGSLQKHHIHFLMSVSKTRQQSRPLY